MVTRVDKYLGGLGIDATGKFEITDNAAAVVGNGSTTGNVFAGTINSGGVELRANDYATLLSARSNDFNTYSVVLGGLTGTNTNLSGNVAIFNGAFTGSNTRLAGAESNVIALQGGLSGSNTNITNLTTGLNGANTNITNLTTGLTGANTNIALRATLASPSFTGNVSFNTSEVFIDSLNDRVGLLTTLPTHTLDVRGTANTGVLTATSVSSSGVELRANDYATYLMALGGLTDANTNITNLTTGLTGTNTNLSGNVAIFNGAFTGSNTRLAGAESNVIALQGGLAGANTIDVNQTTGLVGANTNITNLTTGLTGTNTNLSGNVAIFNGAFTGSNTRLAGAESNVIALQGGLAGANTLNGTQTTNITNLTTGLTGANTNITNLTTGLTGANTNISAITNSPVTFQSNVTILGNLTLTGNTTIISANTISFGDSLLSLASNSTADVLDIGLYGHYSGGGFSNNHTGLIRSVASQDWVFFAAYAKEEPALTVDMSNSTFALANIRVRTANASLNVTAANAILGASIFSGDVELRANDYATYLMAKGGIDGANTNITNLTTGLTGANTNITNLTTGLTGTNTNLSGNVAIFNGAFTGSNTRLAGAESNVIALQGGLAGANTVDVNQTTGLVGANTNITNLTTGLTGANTNITNLTTGLTGANTAIALRALAASPTFTGNATFDTNVLFVDSLNDRVGILTTAPGFSLDVRGTANVGALTATGTVTLGSNANVKITGGSANQYLQTDGSGNLSYSTVQGVPTASIIMYGANTAPSGWLTCDGTAVSRTTYATLFGVVSNVFGIGDNTTTFNLPDFRGRSPYGVDASQSITIGASSAGKINVNFQTATATGTSGSTADTNTVTTNTTNSTTDKDVTLSITVVTGVTPIAHTHTIPALTVTHAAEVVQFIIKT